MGPLFNWVLTSALFLVLVSWILVIFRRCLIGLKILLIAINSILCLGVVIVLPFFSSILVYILSFAVFGYAILRTVSFLRLGPKVRRREMFDGWTD